MCLSNFILSVTMLIKIMETNFKATGVAMVTPFNEDKSIDYIGLSNLIEYLIDGGVEFLVSMGTTGESATLATDEHLQVIKRTIDVVAGRVPVIAGTGSNATDEALHQTQEAQRLGADACLLVTPYYNRPTQEGLYQHYKKIAAATTVPIVLYNVPPRTGCDMQPETVARLAAIDGIVGIKEATGDLNRLIFMKKHCDDNFAFYSGDDETACEFILNGGHGDISVTANLDPGRMYRLCNAALNGDVDLAREINCELEKLHKILFVESNPIPVKYAASCLGLTENVLRLPLTCITESKQNDIKLELNRLNLKGLTY